MRVLPFRAVDYVKATILPGRGLEEWGLVHGVIPMLNYMERAGTFWTVWEDDIVILIAGWHRVWNGVCEVVLFPTEQFVKKPVGILLRLKKVLIALAKGHRRVQLNCRREKQFTVFAQRLGFRVEGILEKFGYDGTDHLMMSITGGQNVSV